MVPSQILKIVSAHAVTSSDAILCKDWISIAQLWYVVNFAKIGFLLDEFGIKAPNLVRTTQVLS